MLDLSKGGKIWESFPLGGQKLFKFTKPEYHPSDPGKTLRLGTLHDFRKSEMGELSDEQEGFFRYELSFAGEWFSEHEKDDIVAFARGGRFSGSPLLPGGAQKTHVKKLSVRQMPKGGYQVNGQAVVEHSFCNSFVFCMSASHDTDFASPFNNETARWSIDSKNLEKFKRILVCEILKGIGIGNISLHYGEDLDAPFFGVPNVHVISRLVSYDKRNLKITPWGSFASTLADALWGNPFSKPPHFRGESEFRILIFFTDRNRPLQPAEGSVTIPFERFNGLLTWD